MRKKFQHNILLRIPPRYPISLPVEREIRKGCDLILNEIRRERRGDEIFEFSLVVVDDSSIQKLNRMHRGKDTPTDVLSFPFLDLSEGESGAFPIPGVVVGLGDIVISYQTCRRQAKEIGHSSSDEFWRLLVHGILHLFGYDHERGVRERKKMEKREMELLEILAGEGM